MISHLGISRGTLGISRETTGIEETRRGADTVDMGITKLRRHRTPSSIARWLAFFLLWVCVAGATHAGQQSNDPNELAQQGWDAIEAKRYGDALKSFTTATDLAPEWAGLWFGRGYAEYLLGRDRTAERSLRRSIDLDGSRGNAYSILGELLYRIGRVDEAIETYETATQAAENGSDFEARLDEWKQEQQLQDGFGKASGRHFRVLFEGRNDDALARRAADILEAAYRNVGNTLRTYPTQTITVLLYTEEQFHDITRAPAWSGGSYDGQIRIPTKGALQDPGQLERILIHEYVHALVAQLGGRRVPHWVNEGLATRLEPGGLDRSRNVLSRVASRPSLKDLHNGFRGFTGDNVGIAYATSALAVNRMMNLRGGASGLVILLQDLGRGVPFETAFHRRMGLWYDEFVQMARRLN